MRVLHAQWARLALIVGVSILLLSWGAPLAHAVPFTLTVTIAGPGSGSVSSSPGGIACPPDCSHQYEQGTTVSLFAYPYAQTYFTGWSGGGCSGTKSCSTTINADTSITATFDQACTYDSSTKEVSIRASTTYVVSPEGFHYPIEVKELRVQEDQIYFDLKPCSGATILNTDVVRMSGEIPAYILLDFGKTGFAPGATPETTGISEIELYFSVSGSAFVSITTTDAPEVIRFGDQGWNLNGDDDVDVFPTGIGSVLLASDAGADVVSGQGGLATGAPTTIKLSLAGDAGRDRLVGTDLQNSLVGGDGADTIIAHRGNDWVFGSHHADVVKGGGGKDKIFGGSGPDALNGGQGVDECRGEKGRDVFRSCEKMADRNI